MVFLLSNQHIGHAEMSFGEIRIDIKRIIQLSDRFLVFTLSCQDPAQIAMKGCYFRIGLLLGFMKLSLPSYWFVAAQSLIDAILIIVIFGGDIRIR